MESLENVELALTQSGTIKVNGTLWSMVTNEADNYGTNWKYASTGEPIYNGFNFYKDIVAKNLYARGTKSRIVDTEHYGERAMYCYETPTPMFGDIGLAQLNEEGVCYVSIDDLFLESVDCNIEYAVFLQKEGEGDLWIETKEFDYFVVKGTPNLNFAWEVKVIQKGFEYLRLDDLALQRDIKESNELEEIADAELLAYENELEELE